MNRINSRWIVIALAVAGLAAATTSSYVHYQLLHQPGFTSFCDVSASVRCTEAYLSEYGSILGVPVAIGGVLYFLIVLAVAAFAWRASSAARERASGYIMTLSLPALAFVLYLAYAAFFVLGAVCILCLITYICVIAITIVSWRATQLSLTRLRASAGRDLRNAARSPLALVIALLILTGTVAAMRAFPRDAKTVAPAPTDALPVVSDADRAKLSQWWELQPKVDLRVDPGNAKVVVVKFNDYQCPPCRSTYEAFKPVFQRHGSQVKLVVKHFPLEGECNAAAPNGSHYAACEAAAAVIMARSKGTAEKLEEWLFANQGPPPLTSAQVRDAARDVAGVTDFQAQYPEALKEVRADADLGTQLKVSSTPTFFINGRQVPSQLLPPHYFNALIEIELKRP